MSKLRPMEGEKSPKGKKERGVQKKNSKGLPRLYSKILNFRVDWRETTREPFGEKKKKKGRDYPRRRPRQGIEEN